MKFIEVEGYLGDSKNEVKVIVPIESIGEIYCYDNEIKFCYKMVNGEEEQITIDKWEYEKIKKVLMTE